jgi:hypothetical protein
MDWAITAMMFVLRSIRHELRIWMHIVGFIKALMLVEVWRNALPAYQSQQMLPEQV